jgi:hypothetical protein
MNSYELSRDFWDFAFENPEKIKPNHCAIYFFAIEHCNRLGWKDKFGFPTTMVMDAIGVKSYNTFLNSLNELVDFGFIKMIEKSKNQYSANIIALSKFDKALDKALDKAFIKHDTKQSESTIQSIGESIDSIDKQINNITSKPIEPIKPIKKPKKEIPTLNEFLNYVLTIDEFKLKFENLKYSIQVKYEQWIENGWKDGHGSEIKNWKTKLKNTLPHLKAINNGINTAKQTMDERLAAAVERLNNESNKQMQGVGGSTEPFSSFDVI